MWATKYRPLSFDDVIGQSKVKKLLRGMIGKDFYDHLIFQGTHGTGKTSLARIFSRGLVCEHPDISKRPCNVCSTCISHLEGKINSWYMEEDAGSNGHVDDISVLKDKVFTVIDRYKVIVLDEAHMASRHAQSSLLKLLEESPRGVIFIFVTTEVGSILNTIRSRCFELNFSKINNIDMIPRLRYISDSEGVSITDDVLERIASLSKGHMRNAVNLLEQMRIIYGNEFNIIDVSDAFGEVSDNYILSFLEAIRLKDDFRDEFHNMVSNINPYELVDEFFVCIEKLIYVKQGMFSKIDRTLIQRYTDISDMYGESIYKLIMFLNDKSFIKFYSFEQLYTYFIYIHNSIKGSVGFNLIHDDSDVEKLRNRAKKH